MDELLAEESDAGLSAELLAAVRSLETDVDKLELAALLSGPYDAADAIATINAGAGGTESQDWAEMLLRMYTRWAERDGFDAEIDDIQHGDEAGIKSATFTMKGTNIYGLLSAERGVHRLVRISPFDSQKRRHTSFASLDVIPMLEASDEDDIEIPPDELRIDVYRSSGPGGQSVNTTDSAVRITHLPTGTVAACQNERSQLQNKAVAMRILKARLAELERQKREDEMDSIRGERKAVDFGSQIRSYVLAPYQMVKDHRTDEEMGDPQRVLDGDIDRFIEAGASATCRGGRQGVGRSFQAVASGLRWCAILRGVSATDVTTAATPARFRLGARSRLVLASFVMLFAELALIRWVSAYQIYVAYFTNFILLASFLGIGVGFLRASSSRMGFRWAPLAFAGFTALVFFVRVVKGFDEGRNLQTIFGWPAPASWIVLPVLFLGATWAMACIAEGVATAVRHVRAARGLPPRHRRKPAGHHRVLDAVVRGDGASRVGSRPGGVLLLPRACRWVRGQRGSRSAPSWWCWVSGSFAPNDVWSPYYRVSIYGVQPAGQIPLRVNSLPHQSMLPLEDIRAAFYSEPYTHLVGDPGNVLIVGAGNGNDVALALRRGRRPRRRGRDRSASATRRARTPPGAALPGPSGDGAYRRRARLHRADRRAVRPGPVRPARFVDLGQRPGLAAARELPVHAGGDGVGA